MRDGYNENVSTSWDVYVIGRRLCRNNLALGKRHITLRPNRNDKMFPVEIMVKALGGSCHSMENIRKVRIG
jgi:hypothetical protein